MNARKGSDATLDLLAGVSEGKRTNTAAMSVPGWGMLAYTLSGDPLKSLVRLMARTHEE